MILLTTFVIGCKSTKNSTTTQQLSTDDDMIPFNSIYFTKYGVTVIELKKIYFYNSSEIKMTRESSKSTSRVVNGALETDDDVKSEAKKVPAETVGIVIRSFKNKVLVSFSKVDPNFQFYFYLQKDGTFSLSPSDGGTMTYPETGKTYNIYSDYCKLLYSKKAKKTTKYIEGTAEGNDGT